MTEQERDAHLREALRHAPDAQVQPPPDLSRFILDEARAKARDAAVPPRSKPGLLTQLWHWLARPSVATGFAGVMAATLVGMMWWGRPMDEALPPRHEPEVAAAPASVSPATSAAAAAAARAEDMRAQKEAPPEALRKPAPKAVKPQPEAQPPAQEKKEDLARSAPAQSATPAPAAATPSAPMVAAAPPPPTGGAAPAGVAVDAAEPARSRAADARRAKVAEAFSPSNSAETPPSIAALRADIASAPARWTWQRPGEAAQPMNDNVYAWLAELDAVTGNRWLARQARESAPLLGRELRLLRDGQVQHSLRLSEAGALWQQGQASWQASLPLSAVQALEAAAP